MLRIVFCVDSLNVGGTELNAVRTAIGLHQRQAQVMVLALQGGGPLGRLYDAAGIEVRTFPIRSLMGLSTLSVQSRVFSLLKATRPDVFHAHDKYSNVFGLPVARAAGVPAVIGSRRWNHADDGLGLALANRAAYAFAHAVLFNSSRLQELVGSRERIPARKRRVVVNFLEPAAFVPPDEETLRSWREELRLDPGLPVIGAVANLRPIKGHATLLEAAHLLDAGEVPFQMVLVGAGDPTALAHRAAELGLRHAVRFAGPRPSRPSFHYLFDISVLASLSEGFSNSILEAMAAERPVVATNVGGVPDAVHDGATGYLVPPRSPHALAAALKTLLEDPALRARMGQLGRSVAASDFAESAAIDELLRLYTSLVYRRPNGKHEHG